MLQVATEAIEASENLHNNGRSIYDWNTVRYNAWHALAVLLSELCQAQPQFDQQLLERAWTAGKSSFDRMADQIAEGSHGPLWTPMKKLMKTAQARMSKLFPTSTAASSPSMIGMQHAQMDHTCYLKDVGAYGSGDAFAAAPGVTESWDANFHPMQDSWLDWQGFTDDVVFGRNDHLDPMFLDPQAQGFMGWG